MTQSNPHEVLGIEPKATESEIRVAYAAILDSIKRGRLPIDVARPRLDEARIAYKKLMDAQVVGSSKSVPIAMQTSLDKGLTTKVEPTLLKLPAEQRMSIPASDMAASRPTAAVPINGERAFKVDFGTPSRYQKAKKYLPLYRKADFFVSEKRIRIAGKRYRPFWFGARETYWFQRTDLINAIAIGKSVEFDVQADQGTLAHHVKFAATDDLMAAQIVRLLPQQRSRAFAKEQEELAGFRERLDAVSPSAPVTPTIVALNIIVFLAMAAGGAGFLVANPGVAREWGSNYGPSTLGGQWWRLFSATFIHFGLAHLVFNMVALYQTGRMTERMFGSTRFLMLYVVAGLSGSVASLLWNPLVNSAGASGAIFGVFGGLLAFALNSNNGIPLSVMNQHRNSTLAFIVFNLYIGLRSSGIDNAAHFGGLIGGLAMGLLLARPVEVETRTEPNFRRLGMVSIFALVALGLISYPLRNPSGNTRQEFVFVQTLDTFAVKEKKALADIQKLQTVKSTMAPAELARMLEQDIAPQWDELYRMIASAELSVGSKRYAMREALLGYLDNRRKSMHLMAEGVRLNNLFILAKAQDASLKAAQQLEEVRKLGAH